MGISIEGRIQAFESIKADYQIPKAKFTHTPNSRRHQKVRFHLDYITFCMVMTQKVLVNREEPGITHID